MEPGPPELLEDLFAPPATADLAPDVHEDAAVVAVTVAEEVR